MAELIPTATAEKAGLMSNRDKLYMPKYYVGGNQAAYIEVCTVPDDIPVQMAFMVLTITRISMSGLSFVTIMSHNSISYNIRGGKQDILGNSIFYLDNVTRKLYIALNDYCDCYVFPMTRYNTTITIDKGNKVDDVSNMTILTNIES